MAFKKKEADSTVEDTAVAEVGSTRVVVPVQLYDRYVKLPEYKTIGSAGMDVYAYVKEGVDIIIGPGDRALIGTGLSVAIPEGFEIQVRPRSGLAFKNGIAVLNSPGTIDSDYRDEIGIILMNHSKQGFRVQHGDRIAQLVLAPVWQIDWEIVDDVNRIGTNRGGGFGSTGL